MTTYSIAEQYKVFGADAAGKDLDERATNSRREFVRGQTMLAEASPEATGHRMTAVEALNNYGFPALLTAIEKGQAVLVRDGTEPARTLTRYRDALGYKPEHLARLAKVNVADVIKAETPGKVSSIHILERLAVPLAIDERILGFEEQPNGEDLGIRLRQLANGEGSAFQLSPTAVAALAEGAWVIARQRSLAARLHFNTSDLRDRFVPDNNYNYPTYESGYRLAAETRRLLDLDPDAPISSMRALVSDTLGIPLVQTKMGARFAGATIANGGDRGIVVNIDGANESVWVRRMTLAHELGHLLWDPLQKLNRLTVDRYDDLKVNASERRDPVEIRANAFAIALLAPPAAVDRIVHNAADIPSAVYEVTQYFGISVSAAIAHVGNVSRVRVLMPRPGMHVEPSDEMRAQEDFTVDYFPIKESPPAVVGRFSWFVARSLVANLISADTAASMLRTTPAKLNRQLIDAILDLTGPR